MKNSHKNHFTGSSNKNWRGGKRKAGEGGNYIAIFNPLHPSAGKLRHVLEHRLVMEQKLGRILLKDEVVHHINGNKKDNRAENLLLLTQSEHKKLHAQKND